MSEINILTAPLDAEGGPGPDITVAFQPVVDLDRSLVYAYEALVRGRSGSGAAEVLEQVAPAGRYAFDQVCRVTAIALAARLSVATGLSVNFLPNALYEAETCLQTTVRAARHYAFPTDRLIFELTEGERVADVGRVREVVRECQRQGLRVAIDDFGAGYAGLNLLADLTPDAVKLDMGLVRGLDGCRRRRAIVHGVLTTCRDLGVEVVAEGVETTGELSALRDLGVRYAQGYLFARPAIERLPVVQWPDRAG
ncbi:diguanylate cyclase/phosphodiesterase (GGDEF & EAL domains) with PAS/PAC sensor(s) [Frigoriglobus tundricola]|uniref:Diguanylate cyclase/phosphodiesterase (GGDEF & EAL domains) with PAS/PAC sensor(S) n=1 Tax=Frigoriglobus tundricola TaxID=2774151 RepID=A0A6M5Z3V6_9BACT|nr:diguanylate cyclase/phosphodiesterase (GGDEF & EAL domains) with PAS/PAC sensor(s) [Frigoriglobus tundricola]